MSCAICNGYVARLVEEYQGAITSAKNAVFRLAPILKDGIDLTDPATRLFFACVRLPEDADTVHIRVMEGMTSSGDAVLQLLQTQAEIVAAYQDFKASQQRSCRLSQSAFIRAIECVEALRNFKDAARMAAVCPH